MFQSFFNGVLFGLALMVMIGPIFFMVVETSINKGFTKALIFLTGIYLSDFFYVVITNYGASQLITKNLYEVYWIGGGVLIIFGAFMFFKSNSSNHEQPILTKSSKYLLFLKGFLVNTTAPGVILIWTASAIAVNEFSFYEKWAYYIGVFVTAIGADVSKAYFANKLKHLITPKTLNVINKISGIVLAIFGLVMWYKGFLYAQ
jgi:threonine/homoserine/homoserine lactone efflux protein